MTVTSPTSEQPFYLNSAALDERIAVPCKSERALSGVSCSTANGCSSPISPTKLLAGLRNAEQDGYHSGADARAMGTRFSLHASEVCEESAPPTNSIPHSLPPPHVLHAGQADKTCAQQGRKEARTKFGEVRIACIALLLLITGGAIGTWLPQQVDISGLCIVSRCWRYQFPEQVDISGPCTVSRYWRYQFPEQVDTSGPCTVSRCWRYQFPEQVDISGPCTISRCWRYQLPEQIDISDSCTVSRYWYYQSPKQVDTNGNATLLRCWLYQYSEQTDTNDSINGLWHRPHQHHGHTTNSTIPSNANMARCSHQPLPRTDTSCLKNEHNASHQIKRTAPSQPWEANDSHREQTDYDWTPKLGQGLAPKLPSYGGRGVRRENFQAKTYWCLNLNPYLLYIQARESFELCATTWSTYLNSEQQVMVADYSSGVLNGGEPQTCKNLTRTMLNKEKRIIPRYEPPQPASLTLSHNTCEITGAIKASRNGVPVMGSLDTWRLSDSQREKAAEIAAAVYRGKETTTLAKSLEQIDPRATLAEDVPLIMGGVSSRGGAARFTIRGGLQQDMLRSGWQGPIQKEYYFSNAEEFEARCMRAIPSQCGAQVTSKPVQVPNSRGGLDWSMQVGIRADTTADAIEAFSTNLGQVATHDSVIRHQLTKGHLHLTRDLTGYTPTPINAHSFMIGPEKGNRDHAEIINQLNKGALQVTYWGPAVARGEMNLLNGTRHHQAPPPPSPLLEMRMRTLGRADHQRLRRLGAPRGEREIRT